MNRSSSLPELLSRFESIGNNCEFGIVQRAADYDPPGLFRNVGFLKTEQIIRAISVSLEGMFEDGQFSFSTPSGWPDYALDCKRFGFTFHTGVSISAGSPDDLTKCVSVFRFLKRKLLEDLRDGEKIFVYRHDKEFSDDFAQRLLTALRSHGQGWLLYVRQDARPEKRFAWAELAREGLIYGGIPRLSAENPPQINFAAWEKIARRALALRSNSQQDLSVPEKPVSETLAGGEADGILIHRLPAQSVLAPHRIFTLKCERLLPNSIHTARASIFVPSDFEGTDVSLSMLGYPTLRFEKPDLSKRDCWQSISVTARVPASANRSVPTLTAAYASHREMRLYSKDWALLPEAPRKTFRIISCADLAETTDLAVAVGEIPDIDLEIAPISFGQTSRPDFPIQEYPPGGWEETRMVKRDLRTYELRDAVIRGEQGVVTVGDYVLKETFRLASLEHYAAKREPGSKMSMDARDPDTRVSTASYLFCGYPGNRNYAHWLVDILPATSAPFSDANGTLAWPKIRHDWQRQTLNYCADIDRSIFLDESATVHCDKLRIGPLGLIDSGHLPHPERMVFINRLKNQIGFNSSARRKLYVSRRDSRVRELLNEDEVIEFFKDCGFEILTLTGMSFQEQVKCFSEASCVVGAHGAGLANIIFCPPDSVFCELLMDNYVQWSMRRLASVVPLRYGCVIGREDGCVAGQHRKKWTVDLQLVKNAVQEALISA